MDNSSWNQILSNKSYLCNDLKIESYDWQFFPHTGSKKIQF